jgi:hypothetical protein
MSEKRLGCKNEKENKRKKMQQREQERMKACRDHLLQAEEENKRNVTQQRSRYSDNNA